MAFYKEVATLCSECLQYGSNAKAETCDQQLFYADCVYSVINDTALVAPQTDHIFNVLWGFVIFCINILLNAGTCLGTEAVEG